MASVNESTLPGPNGDTAATASWNSKLSAMDKSKFPAKSPTSKKPPLKKAGALHSEGKTYKDNDGDSDDGKKKSFAAIKAAREAKKKGREANEEVLTSVDLIEAILDRKPGNFSSIFNVLINGRVNELVNAKRAQAAASLFGEQEVDDDLHRWHDDGGPHVDDEEETPEGEDGTEDGETEAETEEELTELSAALKGRYSVAAKADVKQKADSSRFKKGYVRPKLAAKLSKRLDTANKAAQPPKGVSAMRKEEEETDKANNTKPHVHASKTGNSEKAAHHNSTFARLKAKSVTKIGK